MQQPDNHHFTVAQIRAAHGKVKSGADFPQYIRDIKHLGVTGFETFVTDSHTRYLGAAGYQTSSAPMYEDLLVSEACRKDQFCAYLKSHQQGQSDYETFCKQCAETGIDKWVVDLHKMTCTYYDLAGNEVLVEQIPA